MVSSSFPIKFIENTDHEIHMKFRILEVESHMKYDKGDWEEYIWELCISSILLQHQVNFEMTV